MQTHLFCDTVRGMDTKKKTILVAIVLVAVVLVVAYVGFRGTADDTPTNVPAATTTTRVATTTDIFDMEPIIPEAKVSTEGWKTCRNEEYGYEFKFPGEWKIYGEDALSEPNALGKRAFVRESEECNGASVFLSAFEPWSGALGTADDGDFHVNVRLNESSAKEYLHDFIATHDEKKSVMEHIAVDSYASMLQVDTNQSLYNGRSWRVRTILNNKEYWLSGSFYIEQQNTIETILSTFRFLDTATSTTSE